MFNGIDGYREGSITLGGEHHTRLLCDGVGIHGSSLSKFAFLKEVVIIHEHL